MKTRKHTLLVTACIALAIAVIATPLCAPAQIQNSVATGGSTNAYTYVAAATTNSLNAQFNARDASKLFVFVQYSCVGSNGANVTLRLDGSDGAGNWITNTLPALVTVTNGPGSLVQLRTNLSVEGMPLIRVRTVENPGAGAITNLLINAWRKTGF